MSYRNRVQSLNSKSDSQQRKSTEEVENKLDKLQVVIPPPRTHLDSCLKPIQTNIKRPLIAKTIKPTKTATKKPVYKLVEDKDVPTIIKDYKNRIQYKKLECLGSGAFGRVYKVVTVDNQYYAAKVISKGSLEDEKVKNKLLAEINIHRTLRHENIVRFYSYIEDQSNIYLILELCENRTLSVILRNRGGYLTELEVRFYMAQLLTALRYMSDNRVLHRDLKMSNILLDSNMNCKIGDFGLAALLVDDKDRKRTICGTPHYIAPEILFNFKNGHDHRVDMWSAGVLMFNLLFGRQPFPQNEPKEFYQKLRKNEIHVQYKFPDESETIVTKEAKDLISKLLVNDPDQRISVVEALQHPFFLEAIPDRIPKFSLYRPPEYKDLFSSGSIKKSDLAIKVEKAKDAQASFIDYQLNPPLTILQETIYDPRSQYPIQPPLSESSQKKRSNHLIPIKSQDPSIKRLCSEPQNKPFAVPTALPNRKPMMEEMVNNLKIMMKKTSNLSKEFRADGIQQDKDFKWNQLNIFIETWVDCSKSYGFAYSLSDGTLGFLFNDGSTMTSYKENQYYYIYHRKEDNRFVEQEYTVIPKELSKKSAVFNKFREYEGPELKHDHVVPHTKELTKIHLFKYFVTDIAIAFRLNNGVIQLNFFKHHKLILYDKGMKMIFIDTTGKLSHYNTFDVLSSNHKEMNDAINYAYSIFEEQNSQRQEALRKERWKRFY